MLQGAKLLPCIKKGVDEVHTHQGRLRFTEALVLKGTVSGDTGAQGAGSEAQRRSSCPAYETSEARTLLSRSPDITG